MEANVCCTICGEGEVIRFCLCQNPTKTYLCKTCLPVHVTKPGAHSLFEIGVADIDDTNLSNSRNQSVTILSVKCEEMIEKLKEEKEQMQQAVAVMQSEQQRNAAAQCKEQVEKINADWKNYYDTIAHFYTETSQAITQIYEGLSQTIEKVKTDIESLKTNRVVVLSKETDDFLQFVWHPETPWQPVLDVNQEVQKRWNSQVGLTVSEIFQSWTCKVQNCQTCKESKDGLHLDGIMRRYCRCPSGSQRSTNPICETCKLPRSSQVSERSEFPAFAGYGQEEYGYAQAPLEQAVAIQGYPYQQAFLEQEVLIQPVVRELGDSTPFVYLCSTCAHPQIPRDEHFICLACGSAN